MSSPSAFRETSSALLAVREKLANQSLESGIAAVTLEDPLGQPSSMEVCEGGWKVVQ